MTLYLYFLATVTGVDTYCVGRQSDWWMTDKLKYIRDRNARLPMLSSEFCAVLNRWQTLKPKLQSCVISQVMGKSKSRCDLNHDLNAFGDSSWLLNTGYKLIYNTVLRCVIWLKLTAISFEFCRLIRIANYLFSNYLQQLWFVWFPLTFPFLLNHHETVTATN